MFESPCKSIHALDAWSENQEELRETQPVSPRGTSKRVKTKKKKPKQQQNATRSVSAPQLCTDDADKRATTWFSRQTRVTWTPIQPETPAADHDVKKQEEYLELKDVFAVKVKRRRSAGQQMGGTLLGITLFQCKKKGLKLKEHAIHLNILMRTTEIWFKSLKEILSGFKNRPKSLKVFVNPISHKKEAYQIYLDEVTPLFKLADIEADVTSKSHASVLYKITNDCSLEDYDGVVCVGGDGSIAEVAHGLLLRAQMDAGRDTDSIFTPLQAALPLGIIPAGSTNVVACSVHGIRRAMTAALHIIMGMVSTKILSSYSTLIIIINVSSVPALTLHSVIGEHGSWQTRQGLYLNISIMAIPCLCSMAPNTRSLLETSRSEFTKHLKRYNSTNNQFGFSFIETHTVKAVKLRPHSQGSCADDVSEENEECDSKTMPIISSERTYPWNIDGDLLEVPSELLIRVHPKLLTLFGADMEEAPVKCSCI
uniref:Ceramide kinase-like n=1 Tax=Sinocyclocheilus grahami TaxID=75366 RepID=A0A672NXQ9_SINGR